MNRWEREGHQQNIRSSSGKPKWLRGAVLGILMIIGLSFVFYTSQKNNAAQAGLAQLELAQEANTEAQVSERDQKDQVFATVGTRDRSGAMALDRVPLHELLAYEGQNIKLQGKVKEVLLPVGFLLTGERSNEEIVVIYRVGDIKGLPPTRGVNVIVEGELVRLDMADVEQAIGMDAVHKTVFAPYQGQLAIIAKAMSH
ncbi:MAG: hypothetical protein ACOH5I_17730 [Oligoflexus sp.]